jgi:Txe/YoeB family toxin of Txe-Axe toxin-antitoxin module
MMSWNVLISRQAAEDLDYLRAYHPDLYLEAYEMTRSIAANPEHGAGAPRRATALGTDVWYRNLSLADRIVYQLFDGTAVIAAYRSHIE